MKIPNVNRSARAWTEKSSVESLLVGLGVCAGPTVKETQIVFQLVSN